MRAALAALGPLATRGFPAARARGHSHRALLTAPTRRAPPNAGASSSSFARLRRLHLLSRASTMTRRERASAATTNVRRNNSQKTHVSSLSDPLPERVPAWSDRPTDRDALREHFSVNPASRVFCNRSLNMANIAAVGFDMDYTLAMYKPETFEVLAYESACKKLVEVYGYPEEITAFRYDHAYMVRGLVVDKKRGNILKMDRHKYVKVAQHGFQELDADTRLKTYCDTAKVDQFDGGNYANVDTLFALGETYLFCQLVELRDAMKETDPSHPFTAKAFDEIYDEIRASVDLCHRDGTLKRAVANDPAAFIHADDALVPMLQSLKASGKKVFLLTNSLWDFTNVVMNYLCTGTVGEDKSAEWLDLFDVVVTGSCKPAFFENERAAIFEVDRVTSVLKNTDDGAPMLPIGASAAAVAADDSLRELRKGLEKQHKTFQGGSYRHLHAMLGITVGNQVLYVGDHIYGDILRSKKTLGWRTMLVVPELAHEMRCLQKSDARNEYAKIKELRRRRDDLADALQLAEDAARHGKNATFARSEYITDAEIAALEKESDAARDAHRDAVRALHAGFHPVWGQLMKAGNQNSRFAHQLERYACLYTSHCRNLVAYSPMKSYRGLSDAMPHDLGGDEEDM